MSVVLTDIITLCKQNNRKAQLQLYKQYSQGMFVVAMRYVKATAEAEDIVQEAFIKAFQRLNQFQGEVTFGAWLKRIVINQSIDVLKKRKHVFKSIDETHANVKIDDANLDCVDDAISIADVKQAMDMLPKNYQFILNLYLIEGYDHEEIASILNITQVSSRTLLSRGKVKLKAILKQKDYGERY